MKIISIKQIIKFESVENNISFHYKFITNRREKLHFFNERGEWKFYLTSDVVVKTKIEN